MSEITVKSLAKKYGVAARDIIRELNDQGFDNITAVDDVIDGDSVELVESYFNDLYDSDEPVMPKGGRKNNNSKNPRSSKGVEKNFKDNGGKKSKDSAL